MLLTLNETKTLIENGKALHIAGDEALLSKLPRGSWIGGTTPYFITNSGGVMTKDKLFVDELECACSKIKVYDANSVFDVTKDAYENGLVFLLVPYGSDVAKRYAKEAPQDFSILMTPIVGWVTGFDLDRAETAKTFDGTTGESFCDKAVALHVGLPADKYAAIGIVNIFEEDKDAAAIEVENDTLEVVNCMVDGVRMSLADYISKNRIDVQMPLIANCNGVNINVSIMSIDAETKRVSLYAPMFKGVQYRFASKLTDYADGFKRDLHSLSECRPYFSCNCILNYLYGELNGKATPPFEGAVTFGEIAYQLLNQTLVYVELKDK